MTEEEKFERQLAYYPTYIAHRTALNELAVDQIRSLDKAILTISSGAMGVSVAFLDKITWHDVVIAPAWLMLAWACFTAAILTTALSFWTSHQSLQQQIVLFDQYFREDEADETQERTWRWLTRWLGVASIVGLCAGIGCMGTFVYHNFPQEVMRDEQQQASKNGSNWKRTGGERRDATERTLTSPGGDEAAIANAANEDNRESVDVNQ